MLALPPVTAVTMPAVETVATVVFIDDQETDRPLSTLPLASRGTAVACAVWPGASDVELKPVVTLATGETPTVSLPSPVTPSDVARMMTAPVETPVTTPTDETLAIVASSEDHVTLRPDRTPPF